MTRRARPSVTAKVIAFTRSSVGRLAVPGGDAHAEDRLVDTLRLALPLRVPLPGMADYVAARTEFFDEVLLRACTSGTAQVVLVGAGYDGRSLRFRQPGVRFFELDHPVTQQDKLARLQRLDIDAGDVRFVPVDLGHDSIADALATAGHNAAAATHFICEGLMPYLPRAVLLRLLRTLADLAAPGSTLAVDFAARPPKGDVVNRGRLRLVRVGVASLGERMVSLPTASEAVSLLRETGWPNVELHPPPRSFPVTFALASRG